MDDLDWIALTVKQEAEGEADDGKLAVAFVIVNRMREKGRGAADIVLAPWQFSCWNTDSPTRGRLGDVSLASPLWLACYRAAAAAYYGLLPDPTRGSTSYLNPVVCSDAQRARAGYRLSAVRAEIGRHHFFIAT